MKPENTTIKLSKRTKLRLDNFKEYKRETYEEILEKILEILNLCKINPLAARSRLLSLDNIHKKINKKEKNKDFDEDNNIEKENTKKNTQ